MECCIPKESIKSFKRAIDCLAKVGEDISIDVYDPDTCKLSAVSPSLTFAAVVEFETSFFQEFSLSKPPRRNGDIVPVHAQVSAKALVDRLKHKSVVNKVEKLKLSIVDNEDDTGGECRLQLKLYCKDSGVKTHNLTYAQVEGQLAAADKTQSSSNWIANPRLLLEWTAHFWNRGGSKTAGEVDEITMLCTKQICRMRSVQNQLDPSLTPGENRVKPLQTNVAINVEDFEHYQISTGQEPLLTFGLKEFRSVCQVAEHIDAQVEAYFTKGGSPLILFLSSEGLKVEFVMSTSDADPGDLKKEVDKKPTFRQTTLRPPSQQPQQPPAPSNRASNRATRQEPPPPPPLRTNGAPLFRPPDSQATVNGDDDDDFGMDDDMNEDDLAAIDAVVEQRLSQMPPTQRPQQRTRDSSEELEYAPYRSSDDDDNDGRPEWDLGITT